MYLFRSDFPDAWSLFAPRMTIVALRRTRSKRGKARVLIAKFRPRKDGRGEWNANSSGRPSGGHLSAQKKSELKK